MQHEKELQVLMLLQPDLLTRNQLIEMIQMRCSGVQNPTTMSTERLVEIFRRLLLPLPQRFYRTNRRGKMLTARRAKADDGKEAAGHSQRKRDGFFEDRRNSLSKTNTRDKMVVDERKRSFGSDERQQYRTGSEMSSAKKISLKRPSTGSQTSSDNPKKQRESIKWP